MQIRKTAVECSTAERQTMTHKWAMQADLTALVGGQEWAARRWTSETLAFYNRREYAAWLARQAE